MSVAAKRVASLSFGGAQDGDLNTDLGCTWSSDGPEMMTARGLALIAARAARFNSPLDGVFADVRDPAASNGIPRCRAGSAIAGGSSSIPRRSSRATGSMRRASANSTTTPACWRRSTRRWPQGRASTTVDGKMIDVAMANAARRVLDEAAARGRQCAVVRRSRVSHLDRAGEARLIRRAVAEDGGHRFYRLLDAPTAPLLSRCSVADLNQIRAIAGDKAGAVARLGRDSARWRRA